jgi:hypothetical protein
MVKKTIDDEELDGFFWEENALVYISFQEQLLGSKKL